MSKVKKFFRNFYGTYEEIEGCYQHLLVGIMISIMTLCFVIGCDCSRMMTEDQLWQLQRTAIEYYETHVSELDELENPQKIEEKLDNGFTVICGKKGVFVYNEMLLTRGNITVVMYPEKDVEIHYERHKALFVGAIGTMIGLGIFWFGLTIVILIKMAIEKRRKYIRIWRSWKNL